MVPFLTPGDCSPLGKTYGKVMRRLPSWKKMDMIRSRISSVLKMWAFEKGISMWRSIYEGAGVHSSEEWSEQRRKKKKNHQTTRQHSRFWLSILYCPTGQVKGYSPSPPQCHHPYHSHENTQHIKSAYQLLETELKSLRGLFHLIHHDSLVKLMLLLLSSNYYRWRNQSRKKLHNLPKVNIK